MAGEDEGKKVAELEGQVTELEKQLEELTKHLQTAASNDDDNPDIARALEVQQQALEKCEQLTSALETTLNDNKILKAYLDITKAMTNDEREYCKNMSEDETADFMVKPEEERKELMKKRSDEVAKSDEVVTLEGQPIRKSDVGESMFTVLKAQAKRNEETSKRLSEEIEKREMAELTKRADDEYSHVPGSTEDRAKMLRVLGKMDEPTRKLFDAVLTQSEKLAKAGFSTLGHHDGRPDQGSKTAIAKAAADFQTKVNEIRKRDKVPQAAAMTKARKEFPELFKAFQEADAE